MGNKSSSESLIARTSTDKRKQTEPRLVHYNSHDEKATDNYSLHDTADECGEMQQLEGIQRDLKADRHPSNVLNQFSKLVLLDGSDKMSTFPQMIDAMDTQWKGILEQESLIVQHLENGQDDFDKLKGVRSDYFLLLLETKLVIAGLVKQSSLKKRDIQMILRVVESARSREARKLSESDQMLFEESMGKLLKWIDESQLITITKKWEAMLKRLEEEKNKFDKVMDKFKKTIGWGFLKPWKRIIIGFGALAALGAAVGLIVASVITCGATFVVAGVVMVGAMTVLALNAHDVYGLLKPKTKTEKAYEKIKEITEMLQSYIDAGRELREKVNNMAVVRQDTKIEWQYAMDSEHLLCIEESVKNLDEHLSKYMQQGYEAMRVIDEACAEYRR